MTSVPSTLPMADDSFAEYRSSEFLACSRAASPFDDFFSDLKLPMAFSAAASPIKCSPIRRSPWWTAKGKRLRPLELDDSPPATHMRIEQPGTFRPFEVKWHAFSPPSPRRLMTEATNTGKTAEGGREEAMMQSKKEARAGRDDKQTVDLSAVDGALLARPCLPPDMPSDVSDFVIDVRNSRLAATQMAALRGGRSTLLDWVYCGSTSELKGAYCDSVWFGREELLALSMFRH